MLNFDGVGSVLPRGCQTTSQDCEKSNHPKSVFLTGVVQRISALFCKGGVAGMVAELANVPTTPLRSAMLHRGNSLNEPIANFTLFFFYKLFEC